jgi:hypothetical protein
MQGNDVFVIPSLSHQHLSLIIFMIVLSSYPHKTITDIVNRTHTPLQWCVACSCPPVFSPTLDRSHSFFWEYANAYLIGLIQFVAVQCNQSTANTLHPPSPALAHCSHSPRSCSIRSWYSELFVRVLENPGVPLLPQPPANQNNKRV